MKFDIPRRPAEFGGFNNRWENMGSGGEKRKAVDLPFRVQIKIGKELNMVVPTGVPGSVPFSTFLYGKNPRKPQRTTHVLSPMKIHRKPEHLKVQIYDHELDKRKWLTFEDVSVKDPTAEYEEDKVFISGKLQIHPTWEQFSRLAENVEMKTRDIEIITTQPELLDTEEDEEEEPPEGEQTDIDDSDKDDDEDEEEDDEGDDD